jgi:hypothetical protein
MSTKETIIKRIDELIDYAKKLPDQGAGASVEEMAKVKAWKTSCLNLVSKTFGQESPCYASLTEVFKYGNAKAHVPNGIETLTMAKEEVVRDLVLSKGLQEDGMLNSLAFLERICSRFHLIVRQLRNRHDKRTTLDVNDEYDVQDLMYALLRINFDDIRPEEWTPSYAGGSSRMDFLLKNENIVIETKKTRPKLSSKELGAELLVDISRYREHPNCKTLFCFVYDPEGRIPSPEGLERDLGRTDEGFTVKVLVAPKGF